MRKLSVVSLALLAAVSVSAQATNNSLSLKYERFLHEQNLDRTPDGQANNYQLKMEYAHKFRGDTFEWTDGLTLGFENYFEKTNGKKNVNFALKSSYNIKSDAIDGLEYGPILEYQWRQRGRTPNCAVGQTSGCNDDKDELQSYERIKPGFAVAYRFDREWRIRLRYRYMYTIDHQITEYENGVGETFDYVQDGISSETNFYIYYTPEYFDRDLKLHLKSTIYQKIEAESAKKYKPDDSYKETGKSWKPAFEFGVEYQTLDWGSFLIAYKARPYDNSLEDPVGNRDGIEVGYRMRW